MAKLWIVRVHEDDWDYDQFESAAVWADDPVEAVEAVKRHLADNEYPAKLPGKGRVNVKLAPTVGVVLEHWHAA